MKRWIFITFLSSVVLVGSNTESVEHLAQIYPSLDVCRESTNHTLGKCTTNLRSISSQYAVKEGQVYWMTRKYFNEKPCGMGMASFFPNLTSWKCLRSKKMSPMKLKCVIFIAILTCISIAGRQRTSACQVAAGPIGELRER